MYRFRVALVSHGGCARQSAMASALVEEAADRAWLLPASGLALALASYPVAVDSAVHSVSTAASVPCPSLGPA